MLENNTTQKNIHYVWVGNNKKNKTVKKYINSWKRYFPEYFRRGFITGYRKN